MERFLCDSFNIWKEDVGLSKTYGSACYRFFGELGEGQATW